MISGSMVTSGVEIWVSLRFHYEVVKKRVPATTRLLWIVHELHIYIFCAFVASESVCGSIGTEFVWVLWCWATGARPNKFGKQARGSTNIASQLHNYFRLSVHPPFQPHSVPELSFVGLVSRLTVKCDGTLGSTLERKPGVGALSQLREGVVDEKTATNREPFRCGIKV